jgi:Flp pilus assembly protein TadB
MVGKTVAATIVIVIVFPVSTLVPPMSVVVVVAAILVVLVFIRESCVCRHEKKSKGNGGNPFSSFQRFLQEGVG